MIILVSILILINIEIFSNVCHSDKHTHINNIFYIDIGIQYRHFHNQIHTFKNRIRIWTLWKSKFDTFG